METIADGNLEAKILISGGDEISDMAKTLKQFRDKIYNTQRELVQAAKLAALGQLAAGVAHELNQPLAAIQFQAYNVEKLLQQSKQNDVSENLENIKKISNNMSQKIKHLKDLARKPNIDLMDVNLHEVISASIELLSWQLNSNEIDFDIDDVPTDAVVIAGKNRLEQVFLNIIGNAIDAIDNADNGRITLTASLVDANWLIRIEDTGAGIEEIHIDNIFDPFFTTKTVGEGLGLGLSISYNIVKDFGGNLSVTNGKEMGAVFMISLKQGGEK